MISVRVPLRHCGDLPESTLDGLRDAVSAFVANRSNVRRIRSTTGVREAQALAIHLKHSDLDLSVEAEVLSRAGAIGEIGGVRAVRLLGYAPEENVLITEYAAGAALFNVVWNGTSGLFAPKRTHEGWKDLFESIRAWSDRSHDVCRDPGGDVTQCKQSLRETLTGKLADVRNSSRSPLSAAEVDRLVAIADELLEDGRWEGLAVRRIHGDLSLDNLLLTPEGAVRVLDFADSRVGFALEDNVRLWTALWEIGESSSRRRAVLSECLRATCEPHALATPQGVLLRIWNASIRLLQTCQPEFFPWRTRRVVKRLAESHIGWIRSEVL